MPGSRDEGGMPGGGPLPLLTMAAAPPALGRLRAQRCHGDRGLASALGALRLAAARPRDPRAVEADKGDVFFILFYLWISYVLRCSLENSTVQQ